MLNKRLNVRIMILELITWRGIFIECIESRSFQYNYSCEEVSCFTWCSNEERVNRGKSSYRTCEFTIRDASWALFVLMNHDE